MIWAVGFVLTVAVVVFVGYPLFVREEGPPDDALEAAIAERRGKKRTAGGGKAATASAPLATHRAVKCGSCGASNLPEDKFCARCGSALGGRCGACGAPYVAGDVFCAKCGTRLAGRQA